MVLIYLKSPNIGLLLCSTSTEVHHSLIKVTTSKLEKVRKKFPWSAYSTKLWSWRPYKKSYKWRKIQLTSCSDMSGCPTKRTCLRFNRPLWYWLISLLKSVQSEKKLLRECRIYPHQNVIFLKHFLFWFCINVFFFLHSWLSLSL